MVSASERKKEEENIRDFENFNLEKMNLIRVQFKKSVARGWRVNFFPSHSLGVQPQGLFMSRNLLEQNGKASFSVHV